MSDTMLDSGIVVTSETFLGTLAGYAKTARLVDALVASDNPTQDVESAFSAIEALRALESAGKGYTPAESLGFGSENASTIASAILGKRASTAKIRTMARKIGRAV